MRSVPSLLALTALACIIISVPSADAEGGSSDEIVEGGISYIVNGDEAAAVGITDVQADIVVPSSFTHDAKTYNVTAVDWSFGSESGIVTITLPNSITKIGNGCFSSCTLQSFADFESTDYKAEGGILYHKLTAGLSIHRYPAGSTAESFTIPSTVTKLEYQSFRNCVHLKELNIPATSEISVIPESAFLNCSVLERINYSSVDNYNHLPDSVIMIGYSAFEGCTALKDMSMPDDLRIIDNKAFTGCVSMTRFHLGFWISNIEPGAFSSCTGLTAFDFWNDTLTEFNDYAVVDGVLLYGGQSPSLLCYPAGKTGDAYTLDSRIVQIDNYAFTGNQHIKEFTVNTKVNTIPMSAFEGCTSLTAVHLKPNVLTIDISAFKGCSSLKTVDGWTGVSAIRPLAFSESGLEEVVLPDSIRTIEMFAFSESKLRTLTVPDAAVTIEPLVVSRCTDLTLIDFLGDRMVLEEGALDVGNETIGVKEITVKLIRSASIPDNAVTDEYTKLNIDKEGEHPYPYENLIGVAICLFTLFGVIMVIREV